MNRNFGRNTKLLGNDEVEKLFKEYCVLLGQEDGVLIEEAAKLFGEEAVRFACHYRSNEKYPPRTSGYFKCNSMFIFYLTLNGFKIAASYVNGTEIIENSSEELREHIINIMDRPVEKAE